MKTTIKEKRIPDKCHQSFRQILNLLALTDDTLDGLCEKCSELPHVKRMITRALDQVLRTDGGPDPSRGNRPKYLCIFYDHRELPILTGDIYRSMPEGFATYASDLRIEKEECISLELAREDVFYLNCPPDPHAIRTFQERIHPQIRKLIGETVRNLVGYHIHGETPGLIMGLNYPEEVTRYDGEVMKTLAITVSALSTLAQQITEIKEGFIYLIASLSRAAEVNDEDTGNHISRVNTYAKHLALAMHESETFCNEIGMVAQMHDVGKIHTPSNILRKPGPLTPEEQEIMQKHTLQGELILGNAPRLAMARNIACAHHENFDGTGYPRGLKGDKIPLEARIVKLADVYDALRSTRSYKKPLAHGAALQIMLSGDERVKPGHFDPGLLDLFQKEAGAFKTIYENLE